jgi:hypothetical protein
VLGTDHLGRDYLARLLYGARVALLVGFGTVAVSSPIGITLGLLGGYYGGRVDLAVMYLVMVRLGLPIVLVALAVVGLIGSHLTIIMAVLAGLLWDRFVVVTRALVMQLREREFVLAARAVGSSDAAILGREILPNILAPITVVATLEMANAILLEAALSFLGLGVKPPEASWGLMIAEAKDMVFFEPEEKTQPNIWDGHSGFPGVETAVPLMLNEVNRGRMTIERYVAWSAAAPARAWGLYPRKGSLQPGSDADFVIVDMAREREIRGALLHSKSKITPFEGMRVRGVPVCTVVRGRVVVRDGELVGEPGWGRRVTPGRIDARA